MTVTSKTLEEMVIPMPPMRTTSLIRIGEEVLGLLQPKALVQPTPVDVLRWVEELLPAHGFHIYPASRREMGDCEGITYPGESGSVNILVAEDIWDGLLAGGRAANRARATVTHEVSHGVLHIAHIRELQQAQPREGLLNRRRRRADLKPYQDPEWQAWTLAGSMLAPVRTLSMIQGASVDDLAEMYGISAAFMEAHLRRMKLR